MYGRSLYAWRRAQLIARIPADTSPTPTIASCSPATTPGVGGGAITITGTGFMSKYGIPYIDTVIFDQTIASFSIVSPTSILAIAPVHGNGAVSVIVKGSGGGAVKPSAITFTGGLAPTVSAIAPAIGLAAGGTAVTITVNDSTGCTSATVGGLAITGFAIVDGTHVSGITAAHSAGATDVTVTNMTGTSSPLVGAFTYGVVPAVSAITPAVGLTAGGTAVSITVANSAGCTGATVGGVALTSFAIADGTHVTGNTGAHASGATDVLVTNTFGTSPALVGAFTYGVVPSVAATAPNIADTAGGGGFVTIQVTDSTGCTGATLGGVAVTSFAIVDATHVKGIPGAHAAGAVTVAVTNAFGTGSLASGLEYWLPTQVGSVKAVYDANKGCTISSWTDQTATAGSALQATGAQQPVLTSSAFGTLPGLTFNGVKRMLLASKWTQTAGRSVFVVAKWTSSINTTTAYVGNCPLVMVGDSGGNVQGSFGASAGNIDYADASSGTPQNTRGSGLNDGNAHFVGVTHNSTTNLAKLYLGATQQGADAAITAPYDARWGFDAIGCGFLNSVDGDGFVGTIGAVVVVDGVIAGSDLTKLYAWAQQRWGAT